MIWGPPIFAVSIQTRLDHCETCACWAVPAGEPCCGLKERVCGAADAAASRCSRNAYALSEKAFPSILGVDSTLLELLNRASRPHHTQRTRDAVHLDWSAMGSMECMSAGDGADAAFTQGSRRAIALPLPSRLAAECTPHCHARTIARQSHRLHPKPQHRLGLFAPKPSSQLCTLFKMGCILKTGLI